MAVMALLPDSPGRAVREHGDGAAQGFGIGTFHDDLERPRRGISMRPMRPRGGTDTGTTGEEELEEETIEHEVLAVLEY